MTYIKITATCEDNSTVTWTDYPPAGGWSEQQMARAEEADKRYAAAVSGKAIKSVTYTEETQG